MNSRISRIRNFSIVAHIDHGKSTLADRLIERCGALSDREMSAQVLDSMDIERERGITVKAQTVSLSYKAKDGEEYILNLIDTPGHVDFGYEVSRSLAACEGSILVVDATQGVEAQTLANTYKAIEAENVIFAALNKVDLPSAEPEKIKAQIEDVIGIDTSNAINISAKMGIGIDDILEAIVKFLPHPEGDESAPLKVMLVDSWYDKYLGVIVIVRVVDGILRVGDKIRMMSNGASYNVERLGIFTPKKIYRDQLLPGEIGFISGAIKEVADCNIGDTITSDLKPCTESLPGFKESQPVVFCGLYAIDSEDFPLLKASLAKLHLNDASFSYEAESSTALGFGFRCGFLGLLHLEIVKERLEREFGLNIITTSPSVIYKMYLNSGQMRLIHNPSEMEDVTKINKLEEPWVRATIMVPEEYVGDTISLCTERRGAQVNMNYVGGRMMIVYDLPLNEIVYDFYDKLKSCTKGYASFDWEIYKYEQSDLVKLSILINHEPVDALSMMVHRSKAESKGRRICSRLKSLISRHMFAIPIQAAIGGKIIARETISAMRKDVTAKCYGGDVTRKKKLLEKQKKGKKRMKSFGRVDISTDTFISVLQTGTGDD